MSAEMSGQRVARASGRNREAARLAGRFNQFGQAMGPKGAKTRQRLLDATQELLGVTKIRDLQVANITRVAKTSPATFYVYFNDVSAAVLALIGDVSQSTPHLLSLLSSSWTEQGDHACAHAFVSDYVQHWLAHEALFRVRNLASDEGEPRFADLRIHAVSPLVESMARRIALRQRSGRLTSSLHAVSAAGALLALIERIALLQLTTRNHAVTRETLVEAASFFVILLMGEGDAVESLGPSVAWEALAAGTHAEPKYVPKSAAPASNKQGQEIGAKGARTRQRILNATDSLVRSRGVRDLSVKDITDLAEISASTFYLYFNDVSDVILGLIADFHGPTQRLDLLSGDPDRSALADDAFEFVCAYVEDWRQRAPILRFRDLAADEGDERFLWVRSESVRPLLELIASRVAERQANHKLPATLHSYSVAAAFVAMIERLAATPNVGVDGRVTRQELNHAAALLLAVLLGGLACSA
jgi:AcrR family transcriptional regulator